MKLKDFYTVNSPEIHVIILNKKEHLIMDALLLTITLVIKILYDLLYYFYSFNTKDLFCFWILDKNNNVTLLRHPPWVKRVSF